MPGTNPKIKELRKLFLPQSRSTTQIPDTIFSASLQGSSEPTSGKQADYSDDCQTVGPSAALVREGSPPIERNASNRNKETDIDIDSVGQVSQAIDKLFEPAQLCNDFLVQMLGASDFFLQLNEQALHALESLQNFRDHMRRLSSSFASIRTLQNDLGVLADSFGSVRALHSEVSRLTDGVRIRLSQVATSLDPANALRANVAELAQILEHMRELQAQFYDLSKMFVLSP